MKPAWGAGIAAVALAGLTATAWAADVKKKDGATVLKTEDGLRFQLPADWPVEKHGGLVAPIPVEEYLTQKFSALENRLQTLEQQISGMDVRLRVYEEQYKKEQRLKSTENGP